MLCTISDVQDVLSDYGVAAWSTDQPPFGVMDSDRVERFISQSQEDIRYYVQHKYDFDEIVQTGNEWLRWACATGAAVKLTSRGGQVPPPELLRRWDDYEKKLKECRSGMGQIPQAAKTPEDIPAMSNLRIDNRHSVFVQRVELPLSVGRESSSKPRYYDRWSDYAVDF